MSGIWLVVNKILALIKMRENWLKGIDPYLQKQSLLRCTNSYGNRKLQENRTITSL